MHGCSRVKRQVPSLMCVCVCAVQTCVVVVVVAVVGLDCVWAATVVTALNQKKRVGGWGGGAVHGCSRVKIQVHFSHVCVWYILDPTFFRVHIGCRRKGCTCVIVNFTGGF